jgi:transaldolase
VLEEVAEAESRLSALSSLGVDLNTITDKLQVDGEASFASAYDRVPDAIGRTRG